MLEIDFKIVENAWKDCAKDYLPEVENACEYLRSHSVPHIIWAIKLHDFSKNDGNDQTKPDKDTIFLFYKLQLLSSKIKALDWVFASSPFSRLDFL